MIVARHYFYVAPGRRHETESVLEVQSEPEPGMSVRTHVTEGAGKTSEKKDYGTRGLRHERRNAGQAGLDGAEGFLGNSNLNL